MTAVSLATRAWAADIPPQRISLTVEMGPKEAFLYQYVIRELIDTPAEALEFLKRHPETGKSRHLSMLQAELSDDATARKIHERIFKEHPNFSPAIHALALSERQNGRLEKAYQYALLLTQKKTWINFIAWDLVIRIFDQYAEGKNNLIALEFLERGARIASFMQQLAEKNNLAALADYFKKLRESRISAIDRLGIFNTSRIESLCEPTSSETVEIEGILEVPLEEANSFLYFINRILTKNPECLDCCIRLLVINENSLGSLLEYWLARGIVYERIFFTYKKESAFVQGTDAYRRVLETDPTHPGALHGLAALSYKKYTLTNELLYFTEAGNKLAELARVHGEQFGRFLRDAMKSRYITSFGDTRP